MKRSRYEHAFPLFKQLAILPFRNLYIYKVLKLFFTRSIANHTGHEKPYQLRFKHNVTIPKPNLTLYQHFFTSNGPRLFNRTFHEISQFAVGKHYLSKLKNWLITIENVEDLIKPQI
jgi:hypothetical protein